MNMLPNGCVAVGAEGSVMRLLTAYEFELEKDWDQGKCFVWTRNRVPEMARKMIRAASTGGALITKDGAFYRALKACGIKPTIGEVKQYLRGLDSISF